jgi:cyclophilin family peptidyl-prolyl cis-trans isomerase/HEAT repeat protein
MLPLRLFATGCAMLLAACSAATRPPAFEADGLEQQAHTLAGLTADPSPALREHAGAWEVLLAAEDGRARTAAQLEALRAGLRSEVPELRLIAVRALGRLERPDVIADIAPMLQDRDPRVRAHAANAFAQAARGGAVSRLRLIAALEAERDPYAVEWIAEALGRMPHADAGEGQRTLALLLPHLEMERDARAQLGAARGLYFLARQQGMRPAFHDASIAALRQLAVGHARTTDPLGVRIRTVAAMTVVAAGAADETLAGVLVRDASAAVRREGVLAGAALQDTGAVRRIIDIAIADPTSAVRYEALRVHGRRLAPTHGCAPARSALRDPEVHVRLLAVELLGTCAGGSDVAALDSLAEQAFTAQWHEGARALVSLAQRAPERAHARLRPDGTTMLPRDPFARAYAVRALGILRDTAALRQLAFDENVNVRTAAVQALQPLAGRLADDVYIAQLTADDNQLLQAAANALEGSAAPAAAPALLDALDRVTRLRAETSRDARRALLRRAGELGGPGHAERVQPLLRDFDPVIADLAADVLAAWTGTRPQPAPTAPPQLPLPSFSEAARLATSLVEIEMEDGSRIRMKLLPFEAPTNAARFARLAARGYYDGLTLHRVVPNFVVQGGSPHANEYAGDGPFSRDELGLAGNWRGTVGLSTRGRDTGDAQLFINLIDNVRLDHDYTVFGVVVEGMDTVEGMLEGARMRRVRVLTP